MTRLYLLSKRSLIICGLYGLLGSGLHRLYCGLLLTRKHLHIVDPYLHDRTAYSILVIIRAAMDTTLDIKFVTLVHILFYSLRQATPEDKVVPLGALRHLGSIGKCIGTI